MQITALRNRDDLDAASRDNLLHGFFSVHESLYHAGPAISRSRLMDIARSPAHFKAAAPVKTSREMMVGSATHRLLLESDTFGAHYHVLKKSLGDGRSKAAKDGLALAVEEAQGREVLTFEEGEQIWGMADALHAHKTAFALLSMPGHREVSLYWNQDGVLCRARPDLMSMDDVMVDLKTTYDASPSEFQRSLAQRKYHWQPGFYGLGYETLTARPLQHFVFVVAEREPPHGVAVYRVEDVDVAQGRREVLAALEQYGRCLREDVWGGYPDRVMDIGLPAWARRQG